MVKVTGSLAGRGVPAAVTDAVLAVLAAAGCLALPSVIPPDSQNLRSPDTWWFVLVPLVALPMAVHRRLPLGSLVLTASAASALQALTYVPQLSGAEGTSIGPT